MATIYGVRHRRSFSAAAIEYLETTEGKATPAEDARQLKLLDPFIGELPLNQVHMGSLRKFIDTRKRSGIRDTSKGVKNRTINYALQVVRRILFWRRMNGGMRLV